jgi:sirohydrochlorin cobaltochelatase
MKTVIVLAVHGAPPRDFPREELTEFFGLHARLEHAVTHNPILEARYEELEARVKSFPRTPQNDPFIFASRELAEALSKETGFEVLVGCNEFCAPTVAEALTQAADNGAGRVLVVTPMLTRGGEHAETDIAQAIESARGRHPGISFIYAWPFATRDVASFMAGQITCFTRE